ncbi:hypothetical protein NIES2104_26770 [Leptolyngbya sp. NIES-2104]|nr:hypothetical protein NIES2104_26770 [Leptolyngbya sp. NIES-2104]
MKRSQIDLRFLLAERYQYSGYQFWATGLPYFESSFVRRKNV